MKNKQNTLLENTLFYTGAAFMLLVGVMGVSKFIFMSEKNKSVDNNANQVVAVSKSVSEVVSTLADTVASNSSNEEKAVLGAQTSKDEILIDGLNTKAKITSTSIEFTAPKDATVISSWLSYPNVLFGTMSTQYENGTLFGANSLKVGSNVTRNAARYAITSVRAYSSQLEAQRATVSSATGAVGEKQLIIVGFTQSSSVLNQSAPTNTYTVIIAAPAGQ
jgi:hypothetical protein